MRFSRLSGNITQHKTKIINLSPQQLYVPIYIPPYYRNENKKKLRNYFLSFFLSLLSDSNQRPRDYKSRALAN